MTRGVCGDEFGVVKEAKGKTVDELTKPPPVVLFLEKERNFSLRRSLWYLLFGSDKLKAL